MKKYFSVLAAMALCSGSMLVSCTDDIQIGSLDESQYENVKELKGACYCDKPFVGKFLIEFTNDFVRIGNRDLHNLSNFLCTNKFF